jgi:hypothetical protein
MEAKFVRELLKIAIAQIVSLEFEGVQSSCMDVLSDVVIDCKYSNAILISINCL